MLTEKDIMDLVTLNDERERLLRLVAYLENIGQYPTIIRAAYHMAMSRSDDINIACKRHTEKLG